MPALKEGDVAPDFSTKTIDGDEISLQHLKGKFVILFFYPAAHTFGCTREACGFRDVYEDLKMKNVEIIGVSVDPPEKQRSFKEKYNLSYHLIADTTKELTKRYCGTGLLGKANRITYLISPEGRILKIWKLTGLLAQMNLYSHAKKVKETLLSLNASKS